jgi:hypothetical protein
MLRLIAYLLFQVLPAAAALIYAIYLASVRFSTRRHRVVMEKLARKYKGTPLYEMRARMYGSTALVTWAFVALVFILSIVHGLL